MNGLPVLTEDADFYYDAVAAERCERFIKKYCRHYEGKFAGQTFSPEPIQCRILRDLHGWKWRSTGLRRFSDCYLEGAIGSGKSPLLAGVGLYGLAADGEQGAQVYSLASNYGQARVVFDCAKRFIAGNDNLSNAFTVTQYEIRHRPTNSTWRIVSGKGPGAGCRPSLILGDEAHQWPNAGAYRDLRDRMLKRQQPLLIIATNAPKTEESFCYQLREKAVEALEGTGDPTLYAVIWCADEDAATDDALAWHDANPLLGITIAEEKVRGKCTTAMQSDDAEDEAEFRRLYLGVRPQTAAGRWIDMADWEACVEEFTPPTDAPLYTGLDLSQSDDLCALVSVWVTPDRYFVDANCWMPLPTAERYQKKAAVPYLQWAATGHIALPSKPTIDSVVRQEIAAKVIERSKAHRMKAVCYDRYKADATIAALEAAGIVCVPIAQGYSVSPGCHELDRRLKERSIVIAPNPVAKFCAQNVETKADDRGNIWPVKPHARGRYAGRRGAKIDVISALVTALTEARKFTFPNTKQSRAKAWVV